MVPLAGLPTMPKPAPMSPSEPGRSTSTRTLAVRSLGATNVVPFFEGSADAGAATAPAARVAAAAIAIVVRKVWRVLTSH